MGLGEALMEEQEFRRLPKKLSHALVHKFPSILEYKSPTSLDMPEVVTELIEEPDPRGPFGAKEVGQGPLLPIMPAVANAVYDAVGVRIDEIPVTPEKIMKALAEKKAGRDPRFGPTDFPHINWPEALRVPPPWEGGDGHAVNDVPRRQKPRRRRSQNCAWKSALHCPTSRSALRRAAARLGTCRTTSSMVLSRPNTRPGQN